MTKTKNEKAAYARKMEIRVRKLFKELLPKEKLVKVVAEPDEDWEGDDILKVTVLFDGAKRLDAGKLNELSTRAWLDPANEEDAPFPIFYFLSKSDAREMNLAL